MALLRTISRISLFVSAVLDAWRLWETWRDRDQTSIAETHSPATAEV